MHSGFRAKHHVSFSDAGWVAKFCENQKGVLSHHRNPPNIAIWCHGPITVLQPKNHQKDSFSPNYFFSNRCPSYQGDIFTLKMNMPKIHENFEKCHNKRSSLFDTIFWNWDMPNHSASLVKNILTLNIVSTPKRLVSSYVYNSCFQMGFAFPAGQWPKWAYKNMWAPELYHFAEGYRLYFTARWAVFEFGTEPLSNWKNILHI